MDRTRTGPLEEHGVAIVQYLIAKCRLIVLGIKEGYRRRGIDSILFVETHRAAAALGWEGGGIGWTLEDNDMVNRAIESMRGEKIKNYRVFGNDL